ncbi:MAG TPA: hypothetical protein VL832_16015 [Puia sp.]|nr:hypothetical protein [Puia sp.]
MKRCLLALLLWSGYLHGQTDKSRLHFSLLSGYQHEDFRWSIAGDINGNNPNIYSELIWKQLAGPIAGIEGEWNFWKSFSLRSSYSRLFIVSGKVTDMDYQGDNRTSRSYYGAFDSNKGNSAAWRTTLDYKIDLTPSLSIVPSLGYVLHTQSLFLLSDDASLGSNKLRSTYATTFKGGTLGVRAIIAVGKRGAIEPSLLYDQVKFRGKADWNLIPTFSHPLSFEDDANGYNIEGGLKGSYTCSRFFDLFLSANYLYGNTGKGTDRLYLTNGQQPLTQFNGALRHFWGIHAGLKWNIPCIKNGQSQKIKQPN